MLCFHAAFSQHRFAIRTQLNARRPAMPFDFRIGLAVSLLVISVAATPTRATAQTGQQPAAVTSPAQNENDVRVLELGKPIERKLAGGEIHSYRIALASNQLLRAVVEQKGIDVVVTPHDPDGNKLDEFDSPNGTQGPEPISIVAEATGSYRLDVRPLEKEATGGNYEIKVTELRNSTPQDRNRIAAEKVTEQAIQLERQGTVESLRKALVKYKEALSLWRSGGDRYKEADTLRRVGFIYLSFDEYQQALDHLDQALTIQRTIGDREGEYFTLIALARIYGSLGNVQKADEFFAQHENLRSVVIRRSSNPLRILYELQQSMRDGTEDAQRQALKKAEEEILQFRENLPALAVISTVISLGYSQLGEKQKALAVLDHALSLSRAKGVRNAEVIILLHFGGINWVEGDKLKALDYYNQALEIARLSGDTNREEEVLIKTAEIYLEIGESGKALNNLNQALTFIRAREFVETNYELHILSTLMHTLKMLNKPRLAIFYGKQAVNIIQRIRANIQAFDKETRKIFVDSRKDAYREL